MAKKYPCCLCPAVYKNFKTDVCDDCDFVKKYEDSRGYIFFVRQGIGNVFKTFYKKPNERKERGCRMVDWQTSFVQAQIDLNALAEKKNWKELPEKGVEHNHEKISNRKFISD